MTDPTDNPTAFAEACLTPFPPATIGKLPRVTCRDCRDRKCQKHPKAECKDCGNWITTAHIHLDYVGHAMLTRRLLELDPLWQWEPVAWSDETGGPKIHKRGNTASMWIRLTIRGITRLGVGTADAGKSDVEKELIGDALRNAGMRFGLALDLWSKEDLQSLEPETAPAREWWEEYGWGDPDEHEERRAGLRERLRHLPDKHRQAAKRHFAEEWFTPWDSDGPVAVWVPAKEGKPDGPGDIVRSMPRAVMERAEEWLTTYLATADAEEAGEEPFETEPSGELTVEAVRAQMVRNGATEEGVLEAANARKRKGDPFESVEGILAQSKAWQEWLVDHIAQVGVELREAESDPDVPREKAWQQ